MPVHAAGVYRRRRTLVVQFWLEMLESCDNRAGGEHRHPDKGWTGTSADVARVVFSSMCCECSAAFTGNCLVCN